MPDQHGVLGADYHEKRHILRSHRYRLARRASEASRAIETYLDRPLSLLVDLGTADGMMVSQIRDDLNLSCDCVGIDLSLPLLETVDRDRVSPVYADACMLPIKPSSADVVICTAVIEHVEQPEKLAGEIYRILTAGGLAIVTTPSPVMENIATRLGLLDDDQHNELFDLKGLSALFESHRFDVLETRKFMFSPIGFPGEKTIEKLFGPLGLSLVMANQILIARKPAA